MTNKITILTNSYKTQKDCECDVRKKLSDLGVQQSVKDCSVESFNFLLELTKRHPNHVEKLKNATDFEIQKDPITRTGLALYIKNFDGTKTEISWRICVTGKYPTSKTMFSEALRQAVSSQIQLFRRESSESSESSCVLCGESLKDTHVDHVIHFAQLIEEFIELHKIKKIPTKYEKIPITSEKTFTQEDAWIGRKFYEYHEKNAELRIVCKQCNLTREKYKKNKIV